VDVECLKEKFIHGFSSIIRTTLRSSDVSLAVDCLWHIKVDGSVALTSRDHREQFGLPAAVDVHVDASSRLKDRRVLELVWTNALVTLLGSLTGAAA
jgi:hypothetical protein